MTNLSLAVTLLSSCYTELETDRNYINHQTFILLRSDEGSVGNAHLMKKTTWHSMTEMLARFLRLGDIKSSENRNLFILPEYEKIIKIHLYWKPFFSQ